jgi:hypothetical protein
MERATKRSPVLRRLDALVGEWELRANFQGIEVAGGRTEFHWIEGGAFLVQHADADMPADAPRGLIENWPFPVTTIIGLDDLSERFSYLYSDGRGVSRVYEMTLEDREWKIWGRAGPEFFQRFIGTFSEDGSTISARWDQSADGSAWELDFELTYTKLE